MVFRSFENCIHNTQAYMHAWMYARIVEIPWFHVERSWSWPIRFLIISWGFDRLSGFRGLISGGMQFKHFLWLRRWQTTTFKWWICTGKNSLQSFRVRECQDLHAECLNKMICFYAVFPCSVYYWILFWPISANGCRQRNCPTSTYFQYLSAKFILFWLWPQPITRHETDTQKWLWPGLIIAYWC